MHFSAASKGGVGMMASSSHYANYKLDELQEFLKVWGPLYAQYKKEQGITDYTKVSDIKAFAARCCEVYENLIY